MKHIPVLLDAVLDVLGNVQGKTIIDATFGAGGYSRAMLDKGARVIAFDRDPSVQELPGVQLIRKPFSEIDSVCEQVDAIVFDLGISSMQIDNPQRGFSWRFDAPLDMRMSSAGATAADVINSASAKELVKIMRDFGEEPKAHFIANEIIARRPLHTTGELKDVIERASFDPKSVARVFQALRIYVNDEFGQIETALEKAAAMLRSGGILAVVSFHSLEDRMVKSFMRGLTDAKGDPRLPVVDAPDFILLTRGGIAPSAAEVLANPRARSARLRAVMKK